MTTEIINKHRSISSEYFFAVTHPKSFHSPADAKEFFENPDAWFKRQPDKENFFRLLQKLEQSAPLTAAEQAQLSKNPVLQASERAFHQIQRRRPCNLWNLFNRVFCRRPRPHLPAIAPPPTLPPPTLPWLDNNCFIAAALWACVFGDPVAKRYLPEARGAGAEILRQLQQAQSEEEKGLLLCSLRRELGGIPLKGMGDVGNVCYALFQILYGDRTTPATKELIREFSPSTEEEFQIGNTISLPCSLPCYHGGDFSTRLESYFNELTDGVRTTDEDFVLDIISQTKIRFLQPPERLQFHFALPQYLEAPWTLSLTPYLTNPQPAPYELRSAILQRPDHFITLIRRSQPDGQAEYFLCNNMPSQVKRISSLEAIREMRKGTCHLIYTPA